MRAIQPIYGCREDNKNKDLSKVHPVDHTKITEYVTHSWYEYKEGDSKAKHPWDGETNFKYTGPNRLMNF